MKEPAEEQGMTHEELVARKEEMLIYYKESMPYLQAQFEYEDLLAKIDEVRFKRTQYQIQMAMLMNPPQESDSPDELHQELQKERKLKKS
jgi:hypothetical protein